MRKITELDVVFFGVLFVGLASVGLFNLHYRIFYIPTESMDPTIPKGSYILCKIQKLDLNHGDIIVFKASNNDNYCKRIIGKPGDKIILKDDKILLNGKELKEDYIKEKSSYKYTEIIVPEKSYWVMGDNRNNSSDSREFGVIKEKDIWGQKIVREK